MKIIWSEEFDALYQTTDINEIFEMFKGKGVELSAIDHEREMGNAIIGAILINHKERRAERYNSTYENKIDDFVESKWLQNYTYESAIAHLVKWTHIIIENELEGLLTDDQFFVWYLKDYYGLPYKLISDLREHFEKSGNESTIRDIYMKARVRMKNLFQFCNKYSEYVRDVEKNV